MPLFRPIEPPHASASSIECVDWAARRDPVGHRVHLALAIIALALIPLSSSLATIGSTVLILYALLRVPTLRHTWRGLPRDACLLAIIALYVWLAITLIWSPDPEHGLRLLRGTRYLLLIPALVPLMRHAHLLLYGVCAGVFIQNAVQFCSVAFNRPDLHGGLDSHPGNSALWFTLAVGILLLLPAPNTPAGHLRRFSAIIPVLGIVVSAARSVMLGIIGGLIVGVAHTCLWPFPGRKLVIVSGLLAIAVVVALSIPAGSPMGSRVRAAFTTLSAPDDTVEQASSPLSRFHIDRTRPIWWRIGLESWQSHPLLGAGIGSTAHFIHGDEEILEITADGTRHTQFLRDDYHSLFITVPAQGGAIGMLLLLSWLVLLGYRIVQSGPIASAMLVGFVAYLLFSTLNTTIFTGRLVAFTAVLMAFTMCQLPEQLSIRDAIAEPQ